MFGRKRAHAESEDLDPDSRFHGTMRELVSENALTANKVMKIIDDARALAPGALHSMHTIGMHEDTHSCCTCRVRVYFSWVGRL